MATTSAPHESPEPHGRPGNGAAAARTEALFAEYERTVRGLCTALLRNRAEAEDATQQTFLSAHRALLNGGNPREPAAWLATIARNECWARIRARMREPLPTDLAETEATAASDPVAEALRRADLAALWRAIAALPRTQREALLLREFGGLSYDELAAALAVSGSAVESLLFRARRHLRAAYAAVTGASWVDALARLLAGGGAPVAAKVAALGVGAAAIGSGAVVVPQVFDNHHPRPAVPGHAVERHVAKPAAVLVERVVTPHAASPAATQLKPLRAEQTTSARDDGRVEGRSGDGGDRTQEPVEREPTGDHVESTSSGSTSSGPTSSGDGSHDGSGDGGGGAETTTVPLVPLVTTSSVTTVDGGGGGGGDGTDGGDHSGGGGD